MLNKMDYNIMNTNVSYGGRVMKLEKLNKKVRTIWIIRNILFSILVFLVLIPTFFSGEVLVVVGVAIPVVICIVLLLIWPFLKYNFYSFGYDEKRIAINYGVIFRHRVIIPIRQIQDLHTYNGPIMSLLGLSGVIISTAGSNFSIAGLQNDDAISMVNNLEELLNKRLDGDDHEEIQ